MSFWEHCIVLCRLFSGKPGFPAVHRTGLSMLLIFTLRGFEWLRAPGGRFQTGWARAITGGDGCADPDAMMVSSHMM
jgi:hypothetical protein